jgi:urea transporter
LLLHGFVHDPPVKLMGLKLTYALSQVLVTILLGLVFIVKNKWALMAILAPLGISCMTCNNAPFQFVGMGM